MVTLVAQHPTYLPALYCRGCIAGAVIPLLLVLFAMGISYQNTEYSLLPEHQFIIINYKIICRMYLKQNIIVQSHSAFANVDKYRYNYVIIHYIFK